MKIRLISLSLCALFSLPLTTLANTAKIPSAQQQFENGISSQQQLQQNMQQSQQLQQQRLNQQLQQRNSQLQQQRQQQLQQDRQRAQQTTPPPPIKQTP
ncbi:hypothetical protein DDT52_15705 [Brenneria roseae subsp. roseae]|uniref:DUF2756 domain-containing protein n=1 Tax=Brenneria roseae TaxID=1509241 RepID=UPI000D606700|nr:DUF2756 domain-containing protein [Brenneria roseae]PWC17520.1 hypothetical protein DDT52_15705 [Brenneria roseae subsp. roseae]